MRASAIAFIAVMSSCDSGGSSGWDGLYLLDYEIDETWCTCPDLVYSPGHNRVEIKDGVARFFADGACLAETEISVPISDAGGLDAFDAIGCDLSQYSIGRSTLNFDLRDYEDRRADKVIDRWYFESTRYPVTFTFRPGDCTCDLTGTMTGEQLFL